MYRAQCVLGLLALYVGLSHSLPWDVVLTVSQRLEFYNNNGNPMDTEVISSDNKNIITSIAYDPVHNRVLFAELRDTHFSISSYNIATRKIKSLFRSKHYTSIRIAYDPATQLLFWIDREKKNIHSILSKPGSNNTADNVLINFDDEESHSPNYIAVDSCGGYIYWTTDSNIERARFDGSEREVVLDTKASWREGIAIDQQTQKMYWLEYQYVGNDLQMYVESADLKGENRRTLYTEQDNITPTTLTISKDFIYWKTYDTIRQLSKNASRDEDEKCKIISIPNTSVFYQAIASNYKIKEQTDGNQNCEALKSLLPNNSEPSDNDVSLFCVHGTKVPGEYRCECTQGYIGERCDVSVCHKYCFQGDCSVSAEGQPQCRCNVNYSGERCEVNACQEYCLNSGVCSLNLESEPVCQCTGNYEGERCDVPVFLIKCFQTVSMLRDNLNTDVTPVTLGKGVKSTCASTAA